jgi:hypothetical protein
MDCDFGARICWADCRHQCAPQRFQPGNFAGNVFKGCDFLGSTFIGAQIKAVCACEDILLIEPWEGAQVRRGQRITDRGTARSVLWTQPAMAGWQSKPSLAACRSSIRSDFFWMLLCHNLTQPWRTPSASPKWNCL